MFDPTTAAAYAAAATPVARAQAVRDLLGSGTLTVELRDGESLIYSGTFAGPMTAEDGSLSADALLSGLVGTAGTPNVATWTCRIRNAGGRYIEGSFGPGGRFTWSGGALVVGQAVRLRVSIAAAGASIPAWRQSLVAGAMSVLTSTNTLRSVDPMLGSKPNGNVTNAYSGGIFAPDFGPLGALILHGGGHGDYNGNETYALDMQTLTYQRLDDPTPSVDWKPADPIAVTYADGQPLSCHSYDNLAVIPAALGGGPKGTLLRVIGQACGNAGIFDGVRDTVDTGETWAFDLNNPAARWSLYSTVSTSAAPPSGVSLLDEAENRVIYFPRPANGVSGWRALDLSTREQSSAGFSSNIGQSWTVDVSTAIAIPDRRLGVIAGGLSSAAKIGWFELDALANGIRQATLAGDTIPYSYQMTAAWCPLDGRIYFLSSGDLDAIYGITIPANPAEAWSVERVLYVGGTTITSTRGGVTYKRFFWHPTLNCFVWMQHSGHDNFGSALLSPNLFAYVPVI